MPSRLDAIRPVRHASASDHGHDHPLEAHDLGLQADLAQLGFALPAPMSSAGVGRRDLLRGAAVLGAAGAFALLARRSPAGAATTATTASCADIPEETAGPYPGDGTNGPNVLTASGIVRSDMRSSFGAMTGTAAGAPLTISLRIVDSAKCAPAKGYAVYLWHADREGRYSLYSSGVTNQNYLRAVQETDADGTVTFTTIFPGCYDGRWPHMHFEVYPNLTAARDASKRIATSQVAFPKNVCDTVYATSGYASSVSNLSRVSLASDGVFGEDGALRQLATMTGSVASGLSASLLVPVSATVKASGGGFGGPGGPPPGNTGLGNLVPDTTAATTPATTTTTKKVTASTSKTTKTTPKTTKKRSVTTKKR